MQRGGATEKNVPAPSAIPPAAPDSDQTPAEFCNDRHNHEVDCAVLAAQAADQQAIAADRQTVIGAVGAIGVVASLFLSGAATLAAFKAAREAEKGSQANREAVDQARRSAKAAEDGLAQSVAFSTAEYRPWIASVRFECSPFKNGIVGGMDTGKGGVLVHFVFCNTGRTPAINCSIVLVGKVVDYEFEIPLFDIPTDVHPSFVGSNVEVRSNPYIIFEDDVISMRGRQSCAWLRANATYGDQMQYKTRVTLKLSINGQQRIDGGAFHDRFEGVAFGPDNFTI